MSGICQNWCMYFPKLLHGFVKIDTWISLSCYMDLSKLLHGFVKVVTWICLSCSMYFLPFAKKNQAEEWQTFQSLLRLLFWTKGVEWVSVLNALGPLRLWIDNVFYNCLLLFLLLVSVVAVNLGSSHWIIKANNTRALLGNSCSVIWKASKNLDWMIQANTVCWPFWVPAVQ